MKLSIQLTEVNTRQLRSYIQCCAKIGSALLIEATPSQLLLRVINSAKSACFVVTIPSTVFDSFELYEVPTLNASLLLKHVLAAFRTQRIKNMDIEIVQDDRMTIAVESESGLHKTYRINCVDEEHMSAAVDRSVYPTTMTADSKQLATVLNSFQTTLDEVTLVARPQLPGQRGAHCIQLVSYVDAAKEQVLTRKGRSLRTNVEVAPHGQELFKAYKHDADAAADVTFNLKDFRVMMTLCDLVDADMQIYIGTAGMPVLVEPKDRTSDKGGCVKAELLLASMAESVLASLPAPTLAEVAANALNVTPAGHAGTVQTPGATRFTTPGGQGRAHTSVPRAHAAAPNFDVPHGLDTLPPSRPQPAHAPAQEATPVPHGPGPGPGAEAQAPQAGTLTQPAVPRSLFSQHVSQHVPHAIASLAEDLAAAGCEELSPAQVPLATADQGYDEGGDEFEIPMNTAGAQGGAGDEQTPAQPSLAGLQAAPRSLHAIHRVGMRHEAEAEGQEQPAEAGEFDLDDEEECPATPPENRRAESFWAS